MDVDELHFGRAAERLHVAQPPLNPDDQALGAGIGNTPVRPQYAVGAAYLQRPGADGSGQGGARRAAPSRDGGALRRSRRGGHGPDSVRGSVDAPARRPAGACGALTAPRHPTRIVQPKLRPAGDEAAAGWRDRSCAGTSSPAEVSAQVVMPDSLVLAVPDTPWARRCSAAIDRSAGVGRRCLTATVRRPGPA